VASISKKGKKWQVRIRRVGHDAIYRTFSKKADAKAFANDAEAKLDRKQTVG
jgi:hypothetical protein